MAWLEDAKVGPASTQSAMGVYTGKHQGSNVSRSQRHEIDSKTYE